MRQLAAIVTAFAFLIACCVRAEARQSSCSLSNVSIPSTPGDHPVLLAVKGAWAVGISVANPVEPLVEEFLAGSWVSVNTPVPPNSINSQLWGLASFAPNDVWAVGSYNYNNALIEHWNDARWSIIPGAPIQTDSGLRSVSVDRYDARDVWAAGGIYVEHWNGKVWKAVRTPHGQEGTFDFTGISVTSTGHVWAVGTNFGPLDKPWIDYFDGTQWHHVQGALTGGALNAVVAPKDDDVWAVGGEQSAANAPLTPVIEHWDGTAWSIVSLPAPTGLDGQFESVDSEGGNVWAAGTYDAFGSSDVTVPVVMVSRLGQPWINVATTSEILQQSLTAIAALPDHQVEAVGDGVDANGNFSLYAVGGGCGE